MQVNLNNLEIDYWIKHWINYTCNHLLNIIGHWESAKATLDYAKYVTVIKGFQRLYSQPSNGE